MNVIVTAVDFCPPIIPINLNVISFRLKGGSVVGKARRIKPAAGVLLCSRDVQTSKPTVLVPSLLKNCKKRKLAAMIEAPFEDFCLSGS
jgi:hypothetical protein